MMSFGLTNAPSTFMRLTTEVLKPLLRDCVIVYFDDILIFSKTKEDRLRDLTRVLEILQKKKLRLNLKKCEFLVYELAYLGFLMGHKGPKDRSKKKMKQ